MNNMKKRAWSNLIVWPLVLLMGIVLNSTATDFDLKIIFYLVAFLGIVVIIGMMPILCQKYLPKLFHRVRQCLEIAECGFRFYKKIEYDERDRVIKDRANLAGYIAAFWLYAIACFIASFKDSIPGLMPLLVFVAGLGIYIFTRSAAILIQYGRSPKGEQS